MRLGRKHFEIATKWIPSAATYGTAAGLALVYFTDWRVIAEYIPYYGGKFNK
ncbi:ubiquinol-cytochrome c reductase 6.4 kDa subunit [Nomia melanderi]|uniref:ubiquinol-cytochrome c reductase 6.4 kDa subunit n=1 Tax=Nomia melanderi TaxID=2448451 RepID=UPI0013041AA3|nr:cytochrome b-c1 complex subunit 10 [Nomia melanderi]XP_031839206.1 cytochrome b-c1 complex subunit 10 [Nomia melanderi]XP_031839207.1 cytochrome b-c1 complex subunit 10 [Nomia melanderi]XP_031839208.1 cytochrome b-c1 complex subunit 10 [Nomia melanderi]